MGEFMKFCKDFEINLSKQKCSEVFKRSATNSIEMSREEFELSFGKLFLEVNREKSRKCEKRLREVKKQYVRRK